MKIFLDDERVPVKDEYFIVRSYQEAVELFDDIPDGMISFITFDHDIQSEPKNGFSVAKYLVDKDMNSNGQYFGDDFTYDVHSMNGIGSDNIRSLMDDYLEKKASGFFNA